MKRNQFGRRLGITVATGLAMVTAGSSFAANPPAPTSPGPAAGSGATTGSVDYVPLGTASFGPNDHGSYAWFIEVKTKQVVMCLVHNPQSPIECKRAPIPPP